VRGRRLDTHKDEHLKLCGHKFGTERFCDEAVGKSPTASKIRTQFEAKAETRFLHTTPVVFPPYNFIQLPISLHEGELVLSFKCIRVTTRDSNSKFQFTFEYRVFSI
jgi:hypothetical protein